MYEKGVCFICLVMIGVISLGSIKADTKQRQIKNIINALNRPKQVEDPKYVT